MTAAAELPTTTSTRTPGGAFFLARLRRFGVLAMEASVPAMQRLALHATATAYRDCVALGLRDAALRALEDAATGPVPSCAGRAEDGPRRSRWRTATRTRSVRRPGALRLGAARSSRPPTASTRSTGARPSGPTWSRSTSARRGQAADDRAARAGRTGRRG